MNRDLLIKGVIFAAGAAVGSVVTWMLVKTKYEQIANEEIESVKEVFSQRKGITIKDVAEAAVKEGLDVDIELSEKERSIEEIRDMVQELGYKNEQVMKEKEKEKEDEEEEDEDMDYGKPYVIAPEESWEQDYPTISLTYYEGDGVLTDDHDRLIKNVDELVGEDFASHFGEYEDDSVFIRNDKLKVYYEILRDYGSYSEIDE